MQFACCLTTAPRKATYLTATLGSLHSAGFDPRVFNDSDKSLGAYGNARRALKATLDDSPDESHIILFQDDLRVSAGLMWYLESALWPAPIETIGVISLFLPGLMRKKTKEAKREAVEQGWWKLPLAWHNNDTAKKQTDLGGLAFVFPRQSAERLLANPPSPECLHGWDIRVRDFCLRENLDWWTHSPSLIFHTGKETSIGHSWPKDWPSRQCETFLEDVKNLG